MLGTDFKVAVSLLEANRASFSGHIATVAADFATRGVDVDVVSTPAAPEAHIVFKINLARTRGRRSVTAAEDDVLALYSAKLGLGRSRPGSRLLSSTDPDVGLVPLKVTGYAARGSIVVRMGNA
jgi:hypothetical protein